MYCEPSHYTFLFQLEFNVTSVTLNSMSGVPFSEYNLYVVFETLSMKRVFGYMIDIKKEQNQSTGLLLVIESPLTLIDPTITVSKKAPEANKNLP